MTKWYLARIPLQYRQLGTLGRSELNGFVGEDGELLWRFQVSGVRCQVSGNISIEAETCWSEAEIPSEAKRQRGTLNTETCDLMLGICYFAMLHYSTTPLLLETPAPRKDSKGLLSGQLKA